ncbi:MAG: DNA recombination protein RmuC [Clostridia bacterium]|nr:DNA recombination protein RmuC [Clostridia bacterium]
MEIAIIILLAVLIICVMCILVLVIKNGSRTNDGARMFSEIVSENQRNIGTMQTERFTRMDGELKAMRASIDAHLAEIYKGMGDISSLSSGVNDLRRVLTNVKTRGILGEIQLGAILEEILAPEQYDANVATIPLSRNVVEFAVKLPHEEEGFVYLPIDSKFPLDAYNTLLSAYEDGEAAEIEAAVKILVQRIKQFAKDIHTKYVEPPYTTDFAIMFLPTESLYLEAVKRGLIETLQREYKICLTGPSTMAALLNSLQMGFRTLALEKRASEVWRVLGEVKSEFEKFGGVLEAMQKHLNSVNNDLDNLLGVRMRAMERKLRDIEKNNETDIEL